MEKVIFVVGLALGICLNIKCNQQLEQKNSKIQACVRYKQQHTPNTVQIQIMASKRGFSTIRQMFYRDCMDEEK